MVAIGGGLVLLGALILAAMWWNQGGQSVPEDRAVQAAFEPYQGDDGVLGGEGGDPAEVGERSNDGPVDDRRRGDQSDRPPAFQRRAMHGSDETEDGESVDVEGGQIGDDGESDTGRPEGLGPVEWMAQPDDVDLEALEERLVEGQMRQARELAVRTDQRRSVTAVEAPLRECFDELLSRRHDAGHRVSLGWTVSTSGAQGVVDAPQILHHIGASDEAFEQCVADRIDGLRFDAVTDGEEVDVEYSFFLD